MTHRYRTPTAHQRLTTASTKQSPMGSEVRDPNPLCGSYSIETNQAGEGWGGGGRNSAQHTQLCSVCLRRKVLNWPPISACVFDWTTWAVSWSGALRVPPRRRPCTAADRGWGKCSGRLCPVGFEQLEPRTFRAESAQLKPPFKPPLQQI